MTITGEGPAMPGPRSRSRPDELDLGPHAEWPDVVPVERADRRVLAAVVVAAVATDLAMRSGLMGLAGAVLTAVVVIGMVASGRVTNRRAWPLLLAAPLFGGWFAIRANEAVLLLDLIVAASLLLLGASLARAGDPSNLSLPILFGRGIHAMVHGVLAPAFVVGAFRGPGSSTDVAEARPTVAFVRGALLGAPVVLVVGLLLGSADPVFASFFRLPADTGDVVLHVVLLGLGAWGAAGLLRLASAEPFGIEPGQSETPRPMGEVEAATVLGGLVLVFAAFTVSQAVAVIGGADYVLRTAGLTYAEYARNGFFQLLAVAAITLAVLLALRATVRDPSSRRFLVLSEAAVGLTLLLVLGAIRRLALYEQAYGLTPLRLWALLFAAWIGGVFVLLAISLPGRVGRRRAWFVPVAIAAGLVGLLTVNVANPDARIVGRNVDRFGATDQLDVEQLLELSDDAVPSLLAARDRMTPEAASRVTDVVCAGPRRAEGGFWSTNAATDAAVEARNRQCPAPPR